MFQKAKRQQSKLRLALIGPSGSGKTYSSLLIAKGLGGSIAMIDTERGSGNLYSDLADYDICELQPPFEPEKYVRAIQEAEKAGYDTVIIDPLSHAWAGQGGILEYVDKATQSLKNNFAAWREASPKHNTLVDALVQSKAHIIGTMRSKTAWDVQKDDRTGKTKPVKIGLAPVQREGLEFEFTCVLELAVEGHVASASKDRTSLFDNQYFVPGVETGKALLDWLSGGEGEGQAIGRDEPQEFGSELVLSPFDEGAGASSKSTTEQLFTMLRELGLGSRVKDYERYIMGKYGHGFKDLTEDEVGEQMANLEKCQEDSELLERFKKYLDNGKKAA
jgi:hypothetical protein